MTRRFTLDGSPALEARIAADLDAIRNAAEPAAEVCPIAAVILGGGYGRGEGGVLRENGREAVYNDYDLFVVVPDTPRVQRKALQARLRDIGEALFHRVGVHVDFGPPIQLSELPHLAYTLMYMELRAGHHVIFGPADVLATMPQYTMETPPLIEGARLLMNRGTGLVLSRRKLRAGIASEEDRQFVVRNIQKATLALGDVTLMRYGQYSASCIERGRRFAALSPSAYPRGDELRTRYAEAVDFKLHPRHDIFDADELAEWHARVRRLFEDVHRWFEQARLGVTFTRWDEYARLPQLAAGVEGPAWRNAIRNLRAGHWGRPPLHRLALPSLDHLLRTLPSVLYDVADPKLEDHYLRFWERVC